TALPWGVTRARSFAWDANTPWKLVRCMRAGGMSHKSRFTSCSAVSTSVTPFFVWYAYLPSSSCESLDPAMGSYRDALNASDSQDLKKLVEKNSNFKDCKSFDRRVDCYKLCPEISDDGEFRSVSAYWSTGC